MTEIEKEIKVLQKKLEFLQSIRDHKEQEIKEAYKVAYGHYPETGFAMSEGDAISWDAFKKGYVAGQLNDTVWKSVALRFGETLADIGPCGYYEMSPDEWLKWAKETYEKLADNTVMIEGVKYQKIEEPSKSKTLYIELEEYGFTKPSTIHDICDAVSNWLPLEGCHELKSYDYSCGWNDCIKYLRDGLK